MGSLSGMISGLIGSGQNLPTMDVSALLDTIKKSGVDQRTMINSLPDNVQKLLAQYQNSQNAGADTYQANIGQVGNDLISKVSGLYGPNSDAANAQNVANKQAIYSTVPGTQDAIRNAMAATGGLGRGNAGVQLAQPYVQAAQQYGQAAAGVNASQTAAAQNATKQALTQVASMDANMFQQRFGMTREQAQQILQSGNLALSTQLADLINQSNNQTNQTLNVEGIQAQNGFNNAQTRTAQQGAIWNGLADTGLQTAGVMDSSGGFSPSGTNALLQSMAPSAGSGALVDGLL